MEFKTREKRNECYRARDDYFKCLDRQSSDIPDPKKSCLSLYERFELACGNKWTEHFIKKRDYQRFKEKLQVEGLDSFDKDKLDKRETK